MTNEEYEEGLRKAADWANVLRAVYHSAYDEGKKAKNQWVSISDEEISASSKGHMTRNSFARAIEQRLKDKNK